MVSPYKGLSQTAFWRSGVAECDPAKPIGIYERKWEISPDAKIATAGSCFAQHISRYLRKNGFSVLDVEPAPATIPADRHEANGYGLYSARYGNIYTVHQLLQLAREAAGLFEPAEIVWERDGRFFDALRPSVHPIGLDTPDLVKKSRSVHLSKVRELFATMDLFVFTLGLTETWVHRDSGTVFPTAPETIAGKFDASKYAFKNFTVSEILDAFHRFQEVVKEVRDGKEFRVLLTVSPVPLTATASGSHVLQATTYSKAVLRAVAGQLANDDCHIDYFPSYEIITNQRARGAFYENNLRTVRAEGVQAVMRVFFGQHGQAAVHQEDFPAEDTKHRDSQISPISAPGSAEEPDPQCEEALLEAFSGKAEVSKPQRRKKLVVFIGDSHLGGPKRAVGQFFGAYSADYEFRFVPTNWMSVGWNDFEKNSFLTDIRIKDEYLDVVRAVPSNEQMRSCDVLCLVGLGMLGDGVVRSHGGLAAGNPSLTDGRSISPTMPIIQSARGMTGGNGLESIKDQDFYEKFMSLYKSYFINLLASYRVLRNSGIYKNIFWIAGPDMTERVARFRLGDEYVDSGSHRLHAQIALDCVNGMFSNIGGSSPLILHPRDLGNSTGFTRNEYAHCDLPYDIHTSPEFYRPALQAFFEAVPV